MPKFKRKTTNNKNNKPKKTSYLKLIKPILLDHSNNGNGNKHHYTKTGKLTPSVQKLILEAIEIGTPIVTACRAINITEMAYYNWLNWGRQEAAKMKELYDIAVKELSAKGELDVDDINEMERFVDAFIKIQSPSRYFRLYSSIKAAEAIGEIKALNSIRRAQDGGKYVAETIIKKDAKGKILEERTIERYLKPDWNAGAWWLERKRPALYGQKVLQQGRIEHEHNVKHSVEIPKSNDRVAGVLDILIGSGFIARGLVEHSSRQPQNQRVIDA